MKYDTYNNTPSSRILIRFRIGWLRLIISYSVYSILSLISLSKYLHKTEDPSFAKKKEACSELFNCGAIGLIQALERYDLKYAFTTYSKSFIIHELMDFVNYTMGNPSAYYARRQKAVKNAIDLLENDGREVSAENISLMTGLTIKAVNKELDAINSASLIYIDDENSAQISSEYGNAYKADPEDIATRNVQFETACEAINALDEDTSRIIKEKIFNSLSYEKIGRELGMDAVTVRRLYASGIKKVREVCQGWAG